MRPTPRTRRRQDATTDDPHESLNSLRRRCILGAWLSATVFAGAFVLDLFRSNPGDDMAVSGVERATMGVGVLCALAAVLTRVLTLLHDEQQAQNISWAYRLGGDVADAFPAPRTEDADIRGPSMR